jgi:hypothetical protein
VSDTIPGDGWAKANEPKGILLHEHPRPPARNRLATLIIGKMLSDRLERYAIEALIRIDAIEDD